MLLVLAFYCKFFCHMKYIVLRMIPINVLQIETEHFTFANGFQIAFAQKKRIIDFLAGAHKTIGQRLVQIIHGPLDIGRGKLILCTGIGVSIELAQLTAQDILQQHMILTAALLLTVLRRYVCVTHGLKKFNSRLLACIDFQIYVFVHCSASSTRI